TRLVSDWSSDVCSSDLNYFLRAALNAIRKHRGEPELDAAGFLKLVRQKMQVLHMPDDLLKRPVNEGFSGGEKKRNEIFQMAVLEIGRASCRERGEIAGG